MVFLRIFTLTTVLISMLAACGPEKTLEEANRNQNKVRADEDQKIAEEIFDTSFRALLGFYEGRWQGISGQWFSARLELREERVLRQIGREQYSVPVPGGNLRVFLGDDKTPDDRKWDYFHDLGAVTGGEYSPESQRVILNFGPVPNERTGAGGDRVFLGTFDGTILKGTIPVNRAPTRLELRKTR